MGFSSCCYYNYDDNIGENYRILNLHGMKMKEGRIKKPAESINVSELPAGNYVIQIEGNEFLSNLRFVKMD